MFVVFEGLDGAGKSTLIQKVAQWLTEQGRRVVVSREPGGTPLGDKLRDLLIDKQGDIPVPRAELLLYEAGRAQHTERLILPALQRGEDVLCDRFTSSSVAFQCGGRLMAEADVRALNDFATQGLRPDLEILLDISVELSQKRLQSRAVADRFESEKAAFHEAVRKSYLKMAKANPSGWLVLDGALAPLELFAQTQMRLQSLL